MASPNPEVILDARMIRHSGIGAHIRGLLEGWREVAPDFRPTLLGDPVVLAEYSGDPKPYRVIPFRAPIYGLREQTAFPARQTRGALLHCPHYNIALRHRGPLVITIHDLIHLDRRWGLRPGLGRAYARWMLRKGAKRARHIFAVSQATASAVARRLGVGRDRITVVYNAPSRLFLDRAPEATEVEDFRRRKRLPTGYLLTVGLYKPHKNLDRLLEALKSLWQSKTITARLVVAGVQRENRQLLAKRLSELGIGERVRILEHLPAAELPLLYRGARAMIHPSLLEGFGLPIVEAQAVGCPVVAARSSAIPEVAGEGAAYFDPEAPEDVARLILRVVNDAALRERLVAAGRYNVARFSWRTSARKVLSIYEKIA